MVRCSSFQFIQDGFQPLHMAASNGHIDIAKYLVTECKVQVDPTAQVLSLTYIIELYSL